MLIIRILYYRRTYFCLALKDCFIRDRMRIPSNNTKRRVFQQFIMSTNQNNAIFSYQVRPTNVVEQIMKRVVASKSESKYKNYNTTFILWIYDNQDLRQQFLQDWFVTQLIKKETIDANTKGRKNMREIYKLALDGMNKTDSNYPIIFQKITFNLFRII